MLITVEQIEAIASAGNLMKFLCCALPHAHDDGCASLQVNGLCSAITVTRACGAALSKTEELEVCALIAAYSVRS